MYVRATRVQNPPDAVEKGIAFFKEKVAPAVKGAPGNAGAILLVDRKTGAAVGITMWATAQALGASEQVGISSRTQSAAATGGRDVKLERGEEGVLDTAQPAKGGAFWRPYTLTGVPKKIEAAIKFSAAEVPP